jgi:LacI family transcriptional regulator
MRATIKLIAEMVGVSRGTVDRALNNRGGINPDVSERIHEVARELGYRPNLAAKALPSSKTVKKLGIILHSEGNEFFDEVIRGIKDSLQELSQFGLECEWRTMSGYDDCKQEELIDELVHFGVSGIVLTPINTDRIVKKINELFQRNIKVVAINSEILKTERIAYVGCKPKKSGAVAAGLFGLMSSGKEESIAVITGNKLNLALERREKGFVETIKNNFPNIKIVDLQRNDDNNELSFIVTKNLLKQHPQLDGICFLGAGVTGGLKAISEIGTKTNFKVITYDLSVGVKLGLANNQIAASILQEPYRQGYEGTQIMGKYLLFNQEPKKVQNYTELSIVTKYCI